MEPAVRTVSSSANAPDEEINASNNALFIPDDSGMAAGGAALSAAAATIDDDDDPNNAPANVEEEDDVAVAEDSDYSYEDDDEEAHVSSFLQGSLMMSSNTRHYDGSATAPATIEEEPPTATISKWREPTRQAVTMSLRAEQETKGGKRRLLLDLYRIMNQDTQAAGFDIEPESEDCMDRWTIKLFQFDADSNLAKDMMVLNLQAIELNLSFPEQYPFEPPFVRVTRPRFKRQTGFVMNGALCMELLTKDGWNPINDIESVIVSIRSLLVVGDGRLEAACRLSEATYAKRLAKAQATKLLGDTKKSADDDDCSIVKRQRVNSAGDDDKADNDDDDTDLPFALSAHAAGSYSATEAEQAYTHLSDYHQKKGWDTSGWWAKKG